MKNISILIDTNLILDVLEKRMPFYEASNTILTYCASGKLKGYIALHTVSNIFYILRKHYSAEDRRKLLLGILSFLHVAGIQHENVQNALLRNDFSDFEDCLQDECAKELPADYIITRNIDDFRHSDIPALTPAEFLNILSVLPPEL